MFLFSAIAISQSAASVEGVEAVQLYRIGDAIEKKSEKTCSKWFFRGNSCFFFCKSMALHRHNTQTSISVSLFFEYFFFMMIKMKNVSIAWISEVRSQF